MNKERFEINIDADVKELVIREGKALEVREELKVTVEGNIHAVNEYITKRASLDAAFDKKKILIIIDEENGTITGALDEKNFYGHIVKGVLSKHHELENLNLNDDEAPLDLKGMVKLLKFKKHLFHDTSVHKELIKKLMGFTASITTKIEAANDLKGNKKESLISEALTNLDLDFYITTQIFKGFDKKKFKVNICFDVKGQNDIDFWLESEEVEQIIEEEKEKIMAAKADELKEYVVIQQ